MTKLHRWKFSAVVSALLCAVGLGVSPALAQVDTPHGLQPDAFTMPYIPDLGGLRNQSFKNQYGQVHHLGEAVVVRQSSIADGKATVPAGGLYYISETETDAAPLRRDPFLILGEHAYLVDLKTSTYVASNVAVARGEKAVVDERGYRLWFDYSTDHYRKPYIQLALISPAGYWPLEFPVSTQFETVEHDMGLINVGEGNVGQIDPYFADPTYEYGASHFTVASHDFDNAVFSELSYPVIEEATFSLTRPWVRNLRQEDFRWYGTKRIYAFRQTDGFLVRVTNWSGNEVIAEKLIRPITPQGYKDREDVYEEYYLSIPEHDMRIEIALEPEYLKNSDFAAWSTDAPFGWNESYLRLVVYSDLITVKNGEAWPLDNRFNVGLEANLMTGKLQRLILENAEPFSLDNANDSYKGPTKFSHIWNRPAFTLVAKDFTETTVGEYYVRDAFFERTDNMVFERERVETEREVSEKDADGNTVTRTETLTGRELVGSRENIDFFIGQVPTFVSILEDSFLTRLSQQTYGTVVQGSHFTSFPKVIDDMAFHSPDATAPFVGDFRPVLKSATSPATRTGARLAQREGVVIRGSYVDWRNGKIVIPPAGLYYTSRNGRNVRVLDGESFYIFGQRAYLATFESTTFVMKDFDVDYWRIQPEGGAQNAIYWQDVMLGENNKVLRFTQRTWLDDRPMAQLNVVKFSGNNFGAPFLLAPGFNKEDADNRYYLHPEFAEGATWVIPEFVGENYMRIAEFGTPSLSSFRYTYTAPTRQLLGEGESAQFGPYTVTMVSLSQEMGTVTVTVTGNGVNQTKVLGPLNAETNALLPQHQRIVNTLQFVVGEGTDSMGMVEMDVHNTFEDGKAALYSYVDLKQLVSNEDWPYDDRFILRPDVCGHCYQLNEFLIANKEEIVLDKHNRIYEGPKGPDGNPLFRIVIDSFDGEMIHAWHVDNGDPDSVTRYTSTDNLAFNPRNNIDALLGTNGTTEGFLRAGMMERSAFWEYWRTGTHEHAERGIRSWNTHGFQ